MRVLALDIATTTGFAVDGDGAAPRTGTFRVRGGGNALGPAGFSFGQWLHNSIQAFEVEAVAFEAPLMGGKGVVMNANTSRLLIGLAFMVETVAHGSRMQCFEATVQQVRKHFLGHGRPSNPKQATIVRCRQFGWQVRDHNAADAAALWAYAKATLDPSFRLESTTPLFGRAAE